MYEKYKWPARTERKFVHLLPSQRLEFAQDAKALCDAHPDIAIYAIVVKKQNVQQHIRQDANKLYNYMVKFSLIKKMAKHQVVILMPDQRSIKVKSGNSMWDYLQTELWFTENANTTLVLREQDSAHSRGVQFADFVRELFKRSTRKTIFPPFPLSDPASP
jgi:SHS2 domain-containing protein